MNPKTRNWFAFLCSVFTYFLFHEGMHAITALGYGEFLALKFHWYGPEVIYHTPVADREGLHWFIISGMSNMITIFTGWILYKFRKPILAVSQAFTKSFLYYMVILMLLVDPVNLSLGPFIYGGDAIGMAHGLGTSQYYIQISGLVILLVNRELAAQFIFHSGVIMRSCLLKPFLN